MMKKKQVRKAILKKRKGELDTIHYGKSDIMWFWQWLKLAVDMETQSLSFTKSNWVTGSQNKQVRKKTTKSFKIKITNLGGININQMKRQKKIMTMTKSEIFKNFNDWFKQYKHLFEDYKVHYSKDKKDMIESNHHAIFQVPVGADRRTIDNQIDEFMKGYKLKSSVGKNREIDFIRGVQKDKLARQWKVFKLKTIDKDENSRIAKKVGFQTGGMLKIKGGKTQTQGVRAVQKANESAKCIILNVSNGIFPKSTIE